MKNIKAELDRHHIFCNFFSGPPVTCKQCIRLKELYPEYNLDGTIRTPKELVDQFFPDAIIRPGVKNE